MTYWTKLKPLERLWHHPLHKKSWKDRYPSHCGFGLLWQQLIMKDKSVHLLKVAQTAAVLLFWSGWSPWIELNFVWNFRNFRMSSHPLSTFPSSTSLWFKSQNELNCHHFCDIYDFNHWHMPSFFAMSCQRLPVTNGGCGSLKGAKWHLVTRESGKVLQDFNNKKNMIKVGPSFPLSVCDGLFFALFAHAEFRMRLIFMKYLYLFSPSE